MNLCDTMKVLIPKSHTLSLLQYSFSFHHPFFHLSRNDIMMICHTFRCCSLFSLVLILNCHLNCQQSPAADIKDPRVRAAVDNAVSWLEKNVDIEYGGTRTIGAYALLKADVPVNNPIIKSSIDRILAKCKNNQYKPNDGYKHIYEAGVDALFLADATGDQYLPQMNAIVNFIIKEQGVKGDWDYSDRQNGDTSVTQYAILGLWAASRVGIKVPNQVWEKASQWHIGTQAEDGGFVYRPGRSSPSLNMTAGGTGSLLISRLHLFPKAEEAAAKAKKAQEQESKRKFGGILEKVNLDEPEGEENKPKAEGKSNFPVGPMNQSIGRGMGWINAHFRDVSDNEYKMYYYYTMERMTALANITTLGNRDWYQTCLPTVLKMQRKDGSWGGVYETAFGVLFLVRSTAKLLNRPYGDLGGGLLIGGRGLPDDLSSAEIKNGEIVENKIDHPLDELLKELSSPDFPSIEAVQKQIVSTVQVGDREELIGQKELIKTLVKDTRPEVRRTAIWALGRCANLSDAKLMIEALDDDNVDVLVEARNALCYLSRRPKGLGLPANPLGKLPETASQSQRDNAMKEWKAAVTKKWTDWYFQVRPYDERDDLLEVRFRDLGK